MKIAVIQDISFSLNKKIDPVEYKNQIIDHWNNADRNFKKANENGGFFFRLFRLLPALVKAGIYADRNLEKQLAWFFGNNKGQTLLAGFQRKILIFLFRIYSRLLEGVGRIQEETMHLD